MPNPGDIRYVETTGGDGKIISIKQKYYVIGLDLGPVYINGNPFWYTKPPFSGTYIDTNYFNKSCAFFLPDDNIKLSRILNPLIEYCNLNDNKYAEYSFPEDSPILKIYRHSDNQNIPEWGNYYVTKYYDYNDYIYIYTLDYANPFYEVTWAAGQFQIAGWANYKKNEPLDVSTNPPVALDKDWTLEEVKEKQQDLQNWSNNLLLPPIFGLTNCVYFPSNLGDTKSEEFGSARNPIIKSYPLSGGFIRQKSGDTDNYYGMNYPITNQFIQIKGKKDDLITFNTLIPKFNTNSCRFPIIQDSMSFSGNEGEIKPIDPFPDACEGVDLKLANQYKVNQIIGLRFIEQSAAENSDLLNEQKFNQYKMSGIITSINIPEDDYTKSTIIVKLITDYNLTENDYFNAKVVLISNQSNNFIQNETYSINRYYKKDLGIGPRLGGSFIQTLSNQTSGEFVPSDKTFMYIGVLKDEEKLNKPYENIKYFGTFSNQQDIYGLYENKINFSHEFSKIDLQGQFLQLGEFGGYRLPFSKKYIPGFQSYLIKNLDEHTYEFYQNLKKSSGMQSNQNLIFNFSESNDNVDITFGSY